MFLTWTLLRSRGSLFKSPQSIITRQNPLLTMSEQRHAHVYVTRRVPESGVQILKSHGLTVDQWDSDDPVPRDVLVQKLLGADALFCLLTDKIDRQLIETSGRNLRVVSTMSVGYDHIDLEACREKQIKLGYTPDVLTHATAELTVALLLATSRRLVEGTAAARDGSWGTWKPTWMCGPSLQSSTVGIFGFGRIGQQVVKNLSGFEVKKFIYCSKITVSGCHGAERVSFDTLLSKSDFLIVCCALNQETRKLFAADVLRKMKSTAILINTSRGAVVDMDDLYQALDTGVIRAAGLDVTDPEPIPLSHKLLQLPNCVILPHIGSATIEARSAMSSLAAENIVAALENDIMPAEVPN